MLFLLTNYDITSYIVILGGVKRFRSAQYAFTRDNKMWMMPILESVGLARVMMTIYSVLHRRESCAFSVNYLLTDMGRMRMLRQLYGRR